MVNIVFSPRNPSVIPDKAIIHDNESFRVQWIAFNAGDEDSQAFTDELIVTQIPEGCPGSDDQEHPVVYDSGKDGNPQDYEEAPIGKGQEGPLMQPSVGPFAAGSYRLTVTVGKGVSDTQTFNCIEIIQATESADTGESQAVAATGDT